MAYAARDERSSMAPAALEEPLRIEDRDTRNAAEGARRLARLADGGPVELRLASGEDEENVVLPPEVARLFARVLADLADGRGVTVVPFDAEVTTQQAADLLNVSRPHVVSLLDKGEMPYRKVGSRRRVRLEDVLAYRRESYRQSREAVDELTRLTQELGLDY
jgi:excisionase family DNA binding protein